MSAIVDEGNETVTNCHGLKMTGDDTEQLLRLIQADSQKRISRKKP